MTTQKINCDVPIERLEYFSANDLWLPPNRNYTLVIEYPLDDEYKFVIKTGKNGMGTICLLKYIYKFYKEIYKNEEKYGVWGHAISDLVIEQIQVSHKNKSIRIDVGS